MKYIVIFRVITRTSRSDIQITILRKEAASALAGFHEDPLYLGQTGILKCCFFVDAQKTGEPREKSFAQDENQQQTQPMWHQATQFW